MQVEVVGHDHAPDDARDAEEVRRGGVQEADGPALDQLIAVHADHVHFEEEDGGHDADEQDDDDLQHPHAATDGGEEGHGGQERNDHAHVVRTAEENVHGDAETNDLR